MKTLLYADWETLEIVEQHPPEPAADEVIVEVAACGICGSELESFKKRSPRRTPPLIMGHEFCGTITGVGEDVTEFRTGERVVSHSLVHCGACLPCSKGDSHLCTRRQIFGMHRPGAFAQYVNVPERCLVAWPEELAATSACLAEPLANGVHVTHLVRRFNPATTLILGAGPIGLMCQRAILSGIGGKIIVSDLKHERLLVADRLGADYSIDASRQDVVEFAHGLVGARGVDVVVDCVGSQLTKSQSLEACRPGGAVVWLGLYEDAVTLDSYDVTLGEKTVLGSYAATLDDLRESVELLSQGSIDTSHWVRPFGLTQGAEAFQRMLRAEGNDIKGVLVPS